MVEAAVILAVGHPNHQSRLASNRPRAMLPVLGKPIVLRLVELLHKAEIRRFIVVVGEDEGAVASYLHSRLPDTQIEFSVQPGSSSLTRTLAAIARQLQQPFVLAGYNAFVHPRFPERLLKQAHDMAGELILCGAQTTLSTAPARHIGMAEGHRITKIGTAMPEDSQSSYRLIDLAVCGEKFVQYLSAMAINTSTFTNQFLDMARQYLHTGAGVYLAETAWTLPVETDYDLLTLNRLFLEMSQDCHILSELPSSVQIIPPVRIDPQVSVGQGAQIGPNVYLETGCGVGQGATVRNSVVLQDALVPAQQQVADTIVSVVVRSPNPY